MSETTRYWWEPTAAGKALFYGASTCSSARPHNSCITPSAAQTSKTRGAPFIVEAKLSDLNEDERSFFPDEFDIFDESLTIRLEATLDAGDLTISRYFPRGAGDNALKTAQLKSIRWNMIPSDFSARQLSSGRKTIVDDYLKEVDASGDETKLADAIESLRVAIDSSDAFSDALDSLAVACQDVVNRMGSDRRESFP